MSNVIWVVIDNDFLEVLTLTIVRFLNELLKQTSGRDGETRQKSDDIDIELTIFEALTLGLVDDDCSNYCH